MTVVSGQRTTENVGSVQRAIAIDKEILQLDPSATPFTVITGRLNKRLVGDPEYTWVESERATRFDSVNHAGGYTNSEEEMVVTTEELFYLNHLVAVPRTGEILRVKERKGSNKVKFERGAAGTTAAAVTEKDPLFIIARVAEEGALSFEATSGNPTKIGNNTQIFRTSIEESGTAGSSENQTEPHDWVWQHQEKMREHMISRETAALFGHKGKVNGPGGKPIRTTGGLLSFYTTNNQDMGGTMTESEFGSWVRMLTVHGNEKTVFSSPLALEVVNNYGVGKLSLVQADKDATYGLNITRYVGAGGSIINFVQHPLLEGAVWGGYMIAVDFKRGAPAVRPLGGGPFGSRDTKVLTNRQENDRDGQKDEILTEEGYQFPLVKSGGVATGITG
jgi:Family of unknown function (DUF5309)